MTYTLHPFWKIEKFLRPGNCSKIRPNLNVRWISHHIPKTAGSSLRVSYAESVGKPYVYGIYANNGATEMSKGQSIWVPFKARILHGHFKPHAAHKEIFPNSKKIVWVRDPIERIWSLIGHLLAVGKTHPHYDILEQHFIGKGITDREGIVFNLIQSQEVPAFTNIYARFFSNVDISNFEFVGSVHRYNESLSQLSNKMEMPLPREFKNVRCGGKPDIPQRILDLKPLLAKEYDIVSRYL